VLHPDWMATADLTVQRVGPVLGPFVEARGSVLRRGRTTLVIEALVVAVHEDGRTCLLYTSPGESQRSLQRTGHDDRVHPSSKPLGDPAWQVQY